MSSVWGMACWVHLIFLYELYGKYKLLFVTSEINLFMFSNFWGASNTVSYEREFTSAILRLLTATTQQAAAKLAIENYSVTESFQTQMCICF
jgi:hypothetical protein